MDENKIIAGLKDLIEDRESFITSDKESSEQFIEDKKVLLSAIEYIKKNEERKKMENCECENNKTTIRKDYNRETYKLVKRMKFDNDKKAIDKRIDEIDSKIKVLQDEKMYMLCQKNEIERNYYIGE